jgi:hypothetical protein
MDYWHDIDPTIIETDEVLKALRVLYAERLADLIEAEADHAASTNPFGGTEKPPKGG